MPPAHTVPIARLLQGAREHSPATVLGVCGHRARLGLDPTLKKSIYPLHPLAEPEQTRPLGRVPVRGSGAVLSGQSRWLQPHLHPAQSRWLARYTAHQGICVSLLLPGFSQTEQE